MDNNIDYSLLKGQKLKYAIFDILKHAVWESKINNLIDIHGYKLTNAFFSASYNETKLISKRAVSCFGLLTKKTPQGQKEKIRNLMRKCIWMLTEESGGVPWKIPEIMGAIMSSDKTIAEDYKNILFSYIYEVDGEFDNYLENPQLRKSVYFAIVQISKNFPELIHNETEVIKQRIACEQDIEIIANLCLIIANSGLNVLKPFIKNYLSNKELIEIYSDDKIVLTTLGHIAQQSYQLMD
ncbi:MAG: hypothetical protein V1779_03235 [bacterium]